MLKNDILATTAPRWCQDAKEQRFQDEECARLGCVAGYMRSATPPGTVRFWNCGSSLGNGMLPGVGVAGVRYSGSARP